jgi:hypothetical protein
MLRTGIVMAAVALLALTGCRAGVYEVQVTGPGVNGSGQLTVDPDPTTPPPTSNPAPTTQPPAPTTTPPPPPATTPPPAPATTTAAPPPAGGTTAAGRFGWGAPVWGDEFNYTGGPDQAKWDLPPAGCWPGHAGQGRRCPSQSTVADGVLTQTGLANGTTGWMQSKYSSYRGKWETRMRVVDTPGRDGEYHPVLLLWPRAEDFPCGGEVDYSESTATSTKVDFFLHYSCANTQTHAEKQLNLLGWHNYAVEWNDRCIVGYVDAVEFFRDCTASHLPPRAMDSSIQLDFFPDSSPGPGETRMQVDWTRAWAP